jgi:hypothetical protein
VPDEQNSAVHIAAASRLLPRDTDTARPRQRSLEDELKRLRPPQRIPAVLAGRLREWFASNPAWAEAAMAADCPTGSIRLATSPLADNFPSPFDHSTVTKQLLFPQVFLLAEDGDFDAALAQVCAIVTAAQPPAEYPSELHNVVAAAMRDYAARGVERVLAQGEPSRAALATTRALLVDEVERAVLLTGLRGQRAFVEDLNRALVDGRVKPGLLETVPRRTGWGALDGWLNGLSGESSWRSAAPSMLRYYTRLVEWAKKSPDGLKAHEAEIVAIRAEMPPLSATSLGGNRWFDEVRSNEARLRCALVALAAEQFCRDSGRWPAVPSDLVPKYLTAMPRDPHDLQPLRITRRPDGIVIYSVGPDGTDEGGAIESNGATTPSDLGVRLWNVAGRRQASASEHPQKRR